MSEALSQYRRLQDDLYQVRLLGLRFGEDLLKKAKTPCWTTWMACGKNSVSKKKA